MSDIIDDRHRRSAQAIRELMATYRASEDLIQLGAYVMGSNPGVDRAIQRHAAIEKFLIQSPTERSSWDDTMQQLSNLAEG